MYGRVNRVEPYILPHCEEKAKECWWGFLFYSNDKTSKSRTYSITRRRDKYEMLYAVCAVVVVAVQNNIIIMFLTP